MNTIVTYKVVYVDNYGEVVEMDFSSLTEAQNIQSQTPDSKLYEVQMVGSIKEII